MIGLRPEPFIRKVNRVSFGFTMWNKSLMSPLMSVYLKF